ncbi:S49 family peptidase [Magnetovirga frankeli]|uniref:S49 family peptidase n=1 Tax=Magnetovirga frankeli TaxID=947516 RepID=UPI0012934A8D|nr:S49 family peptidase [gamma proteobacterium SS-5]
MTDKQPDSSTDLHWHRRVLEDLANASLKEQRAARRWGIFFKILFALYLILGLLAWIGLSQQELSLSSDKHTAVVELNGIISHESEASADKVVKGLRDAFKHKGTQAVILRINSPGGSPVQSAYIHDEMLRLRKKYPKIPLYAVVSDICASGGYYVAAAADRIYANESSIVGSIGVLMNGFGFVGAMQEWGVERRLLTAGEHKGLMDPFSPLKEGDKAHVQGLLDGLHQQFIQAVKSGRGERLKGGDELFSGLYWSGLEAKKLGLVDEFGSTSYVAREVVGVEETLSFTRKQDLIERLAKRMGAGISQGLLQAVQELQIR